MLKSFIEFLKEESQFKVQGDSRDSEYLKRILQSVWNNDGKIKNHEHLKLRQLAGINIIDKNNNIHQDDFAPNGDMDVNLLHSKYGIKLDINDGNQLALFRINETDDSMLNSEGNVELDIFIQINDIQCTKIWQVITDPKSRKVIKKAELVWDVNKHDDKYGIKDLLTKVETGYDKPYKPQQRKTNSDTEIVSDYMSKTNAELKNRK